MPGARVRLPSLPPTIYRVPSGGAGPRRSNLQGGGGQGGGLPPKASGGAPTLGFPTLGAGGTQGGCTIPPGAGSPPHFSPWGPSG